MVLSIQILGAVFGIFMFYLSYLYFRKKDFYLKDFLIWGVIWLLFIVATLIPDTLNRITETFHIQGAMWFFTIVSIVFLTLVMFFIYRTVRKDNRKLQRVVRELALERAKKK